MPRLLLVLAGLYGALGVAGMAAASHAAAGAQLGTGATLLLIHAAALLGGTAARATGLIHEQLGALALSLIALGAGLFAADMAMRSFYGVHLFPMSAPSGGLAMIGGWLTFALAAFLRAPR